MIVPMTEAATSWAGWEHALPARGLGTFEWDVTADRLSWSADMFALHGYESGEVEASVDLLISHKLPEDRRRAERILELCTEPGFGFRNLHGLLDRHGQERLVLTVGSSTEEDDGRRVVRGFTADLTGMQRSARERLARPPAPRPPVDPGAPEPLSDREREVLALIARGRTNDEIGRELFVSINTVKTYVRSAYRKIGVQRRSQAVLWALEHL